MSDWIVRLKKEAEENLAELDKSVRYRVLEKLGWLEENFDDILPLALSNELAGYYKLRVGDWRAVYIVNTGVKEIVVVVIGHRKDVYK